VSEIPYKGALDDSPEQRAARYESRWARGGLPFMTSYNNIALDQAANDTAAEFVRRKIADIVEDPAVAKLLQPTSYPIGTKRICLDTDYFETFNRKTSRWWTSARRRSAQSRPTESWRARPNTSSTPSCSRPASTR
jgi:cation diffusion facilitator CzcD-associated flavoprotein CzcO